MTTKEFEQQYTIEKMNRASLTITNNHTGEHLFLSRNAYNAILQNKVEAVREIEMPRHTEFGGEITCKWLQVCAWITF